MEKIIDIMEGSSKFIRSQGKPPRKAISHEIPEKTNIIPYSSLFQMLNKSCGIPRQMRNGNMNTKSEM